MPRTELFRTTIFRSAALASAIFGVTTLGILAVVYWQIEHFQLRHIDLALRNEVAVGQRVSPALIREVIANRYAPDINRPSAAGLFDPQLHQLAGTVLRFPAELRMNGKTQQVKAQINSPNSHGVVHVRAIATRLSDGRVLVFCRDAFELVQLRQVMLGAMALGVLPSLLAGLAVGALASRRTLQRLGGMSQTIERIIGGDLHERLEVASSSDPFDQLASAVNHMLEELERLMEEIRTAGDAMAHDLRTPLARIRAQLEGARTRATNLAQLAEAVDQAISELDGSFSMITALLRIAQFDGAAGLASFTSVQLAELSAEAMELYEPIAEARGINLISEVPRRLACEGDRDLLFEVVMNLLDNAIKFSPDGGIVRITGGADGTAPWLCVQDQGPGIPEEERRLVLRRFHRGENARGLPGLGLGLSLVGAILRLHGFDLEMEDAQPGLRIRLRCWPKEVAEKPGESAPALAAR